KSGVGCFVIIISTPTGLCCNVSVVESNDLNAPTNPVGVNMIIEHNDFNAPTNPVGVTVIIERKNTMISTHQQTP
ncbi:MAG: hypothetical protein JJU02_16690, partial [Cryomorphaceae bacterium]|nr:hypothetical protein [Cryomorphaceae bacterium]